MTVRRAKEETTEIQETAQDITARIVRRAKEETTGIQGIVPRITARIVRRVREEIIGQGIVPVTIEIITMETAKGIIGITTAQIVQTITEVIRLTVPRAIVRMGVRMIVLATIVLRADVRTTAELRAAEAILVVR